MAAIFYPRMLPLSRSNSLCYQISNRCFSPEILTRIPKPFPRVRAFSNARHLRAKKHQIERGSSNSTLKAVSRPLPTLKSAHGAYKSLADTLSSRSSPTLLYQAPSPTVYIAACYSFGTFCLVYAGFVFYSQYLHPMDGTPVWLPVMMGGISVFMTFVGIRSFLGVGDMIFLVRLHTKSFRCIVWSVLLLHYQRRTDLYYSK